MMPRWPLVLAWMTGCAGQAAEPAAPAPPPPPPAPAPAAAAPEPEPLPPTKEAEGIAVEYRVTPRDCDEVAERIVELTTRAMRAELEGKATTDAAAERQIEEGSDAAREAWMKQCEGLVGEVQDRARFDCALAAETMPALDECLNR